MEPSHRDSTAAIFPTKAALKTQRPLPDTRLAPAAWNNRVTRALGARPVHRSGGCSRAKTASARCDLNATVPSMLPRSSRPTPSTRIDRRRTNSSPVACNKNRWLPSGAGLLINSRESAEKARHWQAKLACVWSSRRWRRAGQSERRKTLSAQLSNPQSAVAPKQETVTSSADHFLRNNSSTVGATNRFH